jgi:hypothetical protein
VTTPKGSTTGGGSVTPRPSSPRTLRQVIEGLQRIADVHPEMLDRYVHVLDMEDEGEEDSEFGGLVTHTEVDAFTDKQGLVTSLLAWRWRNHGHPAVQP